MVDLKWFYCSTFQEYLKEMYFVVIQNGKYKILNWFTHLCL